MSRSTTKNRKSGGKCPSRVTFQAELVAGDAEGLEQMVRAVPGQDPWWVKWFLDKLAFYLLGNLFPPLAAWAGSLVVSLEISGVILISLSLLVTVHTCHIPYHSVKIPVSICRREKWSIMCGCPYPNQKEEAVQLPQTKVKSQTPSDD